MSLPPLLLLVGSAALTLGGTFALRRAVRQPSGAPRWPVAAAWTLIAAGGVPLLGLGGVDWAIAVLLLLVSLAGGLWVVRSAELRRPQVRRGPARIPAPEPGVRPVRPWRGVVRTLEAGPLSLACALAACALVACRAPMPAGDRLVAGGLLAPVIWAAAAAWTLTDPRLLRPAGVLALLTGVMAAGAMAG